MLEFNKSREIVHSPGEEDIADLLKKRTETMIEIRRPGPEVTKFLDSVDFPSLHRTIAKIASRCGISEEALNFVDKSHIIEWGSPLGANGHYFAKENIIAITTLSDPMLSALSADPERQRAQAISDDIEAFGSEELGLLHTLIHEEAHAMSRNAAIIGKVPKIKDENNIEAVAERSGVSFHVYPTVFLERDPKNYRFPYYDIDGLVKDGKLTPKYFGFKALNEGIAEKLARDITLSYLETTGASKETLSRIRNSFSNNISSSYTDEALIVNATIEKISKNTGQGEEVVWQGMVNAYLHGNHLEDRDVEQLFTEVFGADFLTELSRISPGNYSGNKERREKLFKKYQLY